MNSREFYDQSLYSKIDFGDKPKLFTETELIDFADEYHTYKPKRN